MEKKIVLIVSVIIFVLILALLIKNFTENHGKVMREISYRHISQDEAKKMIEGDESPLIVDVRRLDEYASGHIPGAICIPNEIIMNEEPKELKDKNQIIMIYCRSGSRSRQAAEKLANMGYTNIYEFGGIMTWTGEVVK